MAYNPDVEQCVEDLNNNLDLLEDLIKSDSATTIQNIPTVKKIVEDKKDYTCSMFQPNREYFLGDIVSYNNSIYVSTKDQNTADITDSTAWRLLIGGGALDLYGLDDIMSFSGDNAQINFQAGAIFADVQKVADGRFRVNLQTEITDAKYIVIINAYFADAESESHAGKWMMVEQEATYFEFVNEPESFNEYFVSIFILP
jgi:hypothetical protein